MAKPQMMVVVKVHEHDELQSIQIYPISSGSVNEKIMVASYEFQGINTCLKIIKEHSSITHDNLLNKCNNSEVLLPDDQLCPNGWNIVLRFIYQTMFGITCVLSYEDHCIEIDHPYKRLFPIIREVLEDLSTDAHWENQEEMVGTYESPGYQAYQAYKDEMLKKNLNGWLKCARRIISHLCSYDAFQDHSAEEADKTDHHLMFQNLASGDRNHRSIKGLAKVVMGVSATASCGNSSAIVKAAYAAAFIASLIAFWLPCKWKTTTRVLTKFGAIACAAGVLATIGYDLPTEYIWVAGLAFIVPAAAVALS